MGQQVGNINDKIVGNADLVLSDGTNSLTFHRPSLVGSTTFNLPSGDGTLGKILTTDGSGNLSWSGSATYPVDAYTFGFENKTETNISFDGIDTFTLTDNGSGWSYYRSGVKCYISGTKTRQLASPMVDGTIYYIYIDATTGALSSSTSAWTLNDTKVPVATVAWNNTLTPKYVMCDERHTCRVSRAWHRYHHFTEGTVCSTPGTVTGLVAGSDTPADKTFGITGTGIFDEDLYYALATLVDPDGATNTYYNLYRTSTTSYAWLFGDMPFKYANLGGSTYGFIEYDNAGTSTQATANTFVNTYIVAGNVVANNEANPEISTSGLRYLIIQGRGAYSSSALAIGESFASFDLTGFTLVEAIAIYQLTWATTNRPNTVKGRCRFVSIQKVDTNVIQTSIVATANHNTLAGLEGGTINEYFHLTSSEYLGVQATIKVAGAAQTTDASPTTLATFTLTDNTVYHLKGRVAARHNSNTDRGSWEIDATAYRANSGAATILGSITSIHTDTSDTSWDATFLANSNSINLTVTGKAGTTINWGGLLEYNSV